MMDTVARLTRRVERERKARKEAETLLEKKSLELYWSNQELKHLAADLVEKEERSRSILEAAVDGIVTIDERGIIETFNRAAQVIFGYSSEAAVGLRFSVFLAGGEEDEYSPDRLMRMVVGGKSMSIQEITGRRRDGSSFPMDLAVSETRLGERRLFIAVVRDISRRRQAEDERVKMEVQLRQAQKLESIGQLAAGIAHEINTPTQFVNDNTRFLQDAFEDYDQLLEHYQRLFRAAEDGAIDKERIDKVKGFAEEIDLKYLREEIPQAVKQSLEGLERIAKIVRAMKEFSHPGVEAKTQIDINNAIETTINVSHNEWKYHAEMETDLDPALQAVPCLPGEISQVLLNLIVNAAHAIADVVGESGEKGTIRIATRHDGEWAEIKVSDNGTGIPKKIRDRIFDPFFTTKGVGKGTGQGLAIAYSVVVDKHGGQISLESTEGQGSIFIIRLPLATDVYG